MSVSIERSGNLLNLFINNVHIVNFPWILLLELYLQLQHFGFLMEIGTERYSNIVLTLIISFL